MLESCARAEKAAGVHKRSGGWRARTRTMLGGHVRLIESRACSDLSLLKSAKGKSIVAARSVAAGLLVESQDRHRAEKLRLAVTVWIKAGNADAVQSRSLAGKDGLLLAAKLLVREHLSVQKLADGADWLRDLGLSWRLEQGSRPLHTSGAENSADFAGLCDVGNSSWVNAVVQRVHTCAPLRDAFLARKRRWVL